MSNILTDMFPAFKMLIVIYIFSVIYEISRKDLKRKIEYWSRIFEFEDDDLMFYKSFLCLENDNIAKNENSDTTEKKEKEKYENKYLEKLRLKTLDNDLRHLPFDNLELEMETNFFEELKENHFKSLRDRELSLRKDITVYELMMDDDDELAEFLSGNCCLEEDVDELIEKNREHALNFVREKIDNLREELKVINETPFTEENEDEFRANAKETVINKRLEKLKNTHVVEKTPLGNVIMHWDNVKCSFVYYSDNTIPYRYLEAVGRKYALTYNCKSVFFDMEMEVKKAEEKIEKERLMEEEEKKKKEDEEQSKINDSSTTVTTEKKNVFAKFKNYNKNNSKNTVASGAGPKTNTISNNQDSNGKTDAKVVLKENANKYISEGKIANFNILKKVDKKVFNKRLELSFSEFKKMQMQNKQTK